jgi:hypothetical protein
MSWLNRLRNHMRLEAQRATADISLPRAAIVTGSIDPARYAARVLLQPENTLTGYLPIASPWVGNGWGFFALPSPGDVVDVIFQQGGGGAGVIIGRQFNAKAQPVPTTPGELWIVHKSGSTIKFTNDGDIIITANRDLNLHAAAVSSSTPMVKARFGTEAVSRHGRTTMSPSLITHTRRRRFHHED